jgi:hypothetical protein
MPIISSSNKFPRYPQTALPHSAIACVAADLRPALGAGLAAPQFPNAYFLPPRNKFPLELGRKTNIARILRLGPCIAYTIARE